MKKYLTQTCLLIFALMIVMAGIAIKKYNIEWRRSHPVKKVFTSAPCMDTVGKDWVNWADSL